MIASLPLEKPAYCVPDPALIPISLQIRSLERGSRLVLSDPTSSRVILQMPRGNLELIHPRPLLLTHLAQLIDNFQVRGSEVCRLDYDIIILF